MCGLFGFSSYDEQPVKELSKLTNSLARQSVVRGTDSTGIAYNRSGYITIQKDAKAADKMEFKHGDDIKAIIGHTRHSTQGSEKKNYNNHPFHGKTKNTRFALAHNGIIWNDDELKLKYRLPKTKIETDSYVAVQLIEHKRTLDAESLKFMAEQVDGSFSFSILDDKNNLYLVKGDSPLSILHFPRLKMYVYASTDEILYRALINTNLLSEIKNKDYDEIVLKEGEILKIKPDGATEKTEFDFCRSYYSKQWWECGYPYRSIMPKSTANEARQEYIEELEYAAMCQGIDPQVVGELLNENFTLLQWKMLFGFEK
jgi:glucosamine 6-phosphate synthetase-like amidotransferase/phosphosugar isomerase protein